MEQKIKTIIATAVQAAGFTKHAPIQLTPAKNFGDFATNIALQLAKQARTNPREIATKICQHISNQHIKKTTIDGPGFINILIDSKWWQKQIAEILTKQNRYGSATSKQYTNIEFVSANPTGYLHTGHARGAIIGSVLTNLLEFVGHRVDAEYYVNDAGVQIGVLGESVFVRYQNLFGANLSLPETSYGGEDIVDCAKALKDKFGKKYVGAKFADVKKIFMLEGRTYFLDQIKQDLTSYGVRMDLYSSELDQYEPGHIDATLKQLADKNHTYHKDGALWLKTTDQGDDKDRVLIKSDGTYTYITPDISYHNDKIARGYNELINIWGGDHIGYIKRMEIALGYLGLPKEQLDIIVVQMVRLLKGGQELKMSKRKGVTFTMKELLQEIGKDAARWFMVDKSASAHFTLDLDQASARTMVSGVFQVQYTHARIHQLLNKAKLHQSATIAHYEYKNLEVKLIKKMLAFKKVVTGIATSHKVHLLPQYLLELASHYNSFYSNTKIIGTEHAVPLLDISRATMIILNNGLQILGITAPQKM